MNRKPMVTIVLSEREK